MIMSISQISQISNHIQKACMFIKNDMVLSILEKKIETYAAI